MGIWDAVKKVGTVAVDTCLLPVDVVADAVSIGDDTESNVAERVKKIAGGVSDAYDETKQ